MEMKVVRRCFSCGAPLQDSDPSRPGYIDPAVLARRSEDSVVYCNSCYEKRKFNATPAHVSGISKGFKTMLLDARASDSLIVYVIDLFSFECSFVVEVSSLIRGLPILVIANKRDLLPKDCDDEAIKKYVAARFKGEGLPVDSSDVVLTSLSSFCDISEAMGLLELKRRRHDAYLIGAKMSGKSFFVSSFIRLFSNPSKKAISVSDYPGTDVRVMAIPLDSSSCLYDTPGTDLSNSYLAYLQPSEIEKIVPKKAVKGRKGELKASEILSVGNLAHLEALQGSAKLVSHFAPDVSLKKGNVPAKKEIDWDKLLARSGFVPRSSLLKEATDFDAFELDFHHEKGVDVGIAGLGWWHFVSKKESCFRLYVKKGVGVYLSREAKAIDG